MNKYGINVPSGKVARTSQEAIQIARELGILNNIMNSMNNYVFRS